jgi:hypothetical protein
MTRSGRFPPCMATLLRRGIRATVSSGVPLHPAAATVIRVAGQFLDEELPALPAQTATKTAGPLLVPAGAVDHVEQRLAL